MLKAFHVQREKGGEERKRKREKEKEEGKREKPRSIASNYLVGKRCVNTGHTVFPRLFRVLHLHCLPLLFSVSLYPSIHLLYCLYTCAFLPCIFSQARRISPSAFRLPCLFVALCPEIRDLWRARTIVQKEGNSFDKKGTCTRMDNRTYFSTLARIAFRNASCNNCLDDFSYFEILHSYFEYFAHIVKVLD